MALVVKNLSAKAGNAGSTPGSVRSPEEETATHSRILAWRIPWTEEPGGLQSPGRDPAAGAGLPEQPALTHSRGTGWAGGGFYPRPFTAVPRYLGTRLNSPETPRTHPSPQPGSAFPLPLPGLPTASVAFWLFLIKPLPLPATGPLLKLCLPPAAPTSPSPSDDRLNPPILSRGTPPPFPAGAVAPLP